MQEQPLIPDLPVLFEDELVVVVNKPSGLLSQPGRIEPDSVVTRVLAHRSDIHGPALVHRLDMDTSGILLLAKTRSAHRSLQQQFERRMIAKRYQARLTHAPDGLGGSIQLPLRLDIDNRPSQIVCALHGKSSTTLWHKTGSADGRSVALYPLTGRTHQLRVHMASSQGLGIAIVGDRLYGHNNSGVSGQRLMLHADFLSFNHPATEDRLCVVCEAPFAA